MVSILMLTHNATAYVRHSILTLVNNTQNTEYELIVLDNASNDRTRKLLLKLQKRGMIDKIIFEKYNTLFAKGNNVASKITSDKSDYVLLLNSDVEIRDPNWLNYLIDNYESGAIAYGVCENNPYTRADGFCFLIGTELYKHYFLDERFEWWWSVTKLQAQLLKEGYKIKAVSNYNTQLYHYGGASGKDWQNAKGMQIEGNEIKDWFNCGGGGVEVIPQIAPAQEIRTSLFDIYANLVKHLKNVYSRIQNHIDGKH